MLMQFTSLKEAKVDAQCGYTSTLQKIANKFHTENILCITHGMIQIPKQD